MESLIGKKAKGFKFKGNPTYVPTRMDQYNGVVGVITYTDGNVIQIKFSSGKSWNYPYKEALDHLVEEEQSIEEILNNIKNLTKQI